MSRTHHPTRRTALKTIAAAAVGGLAATGTAAAHDRCTPSERRSRRNAVEIVALHDHDADEHRFVLDTDEVAAGWTTLTLTNRTPHTHFAYLQKIPDAAVEEAADQTTPLLDYWVDQITEPFQVFMDYLLGDAPEPPTFPSWFGDIEPRGGPGLTAGGLSSTTTVHLDPGQYQVECYVKDADNVFHSTNGMVGLLTVTGDDAGAPEPRPTTELSLSTTDGITAPARLRPGLHTVAVTFEDQQAYDHLLGHDVHLVRYDDATDAERVAGWMDWSNGFGTTANQLVSDGTEPGQFRGGVQDVWTDDLPGTGYLHTVLTPGEYAWVAEVPDPADSGLLVEFSVPGRAAGHGEDGRSGYGVRAGAGRAGGPFRPRTSFLRP